LQPRIVSHQPVARICRVHESKAAVRPGRLQVHDDVVLAGHNGAVRGLQLADESIPVGDPGVVGGFELSDNRRMLACPVLASARHLHQRLGVLFPACLLGCQGGLERGDALRLQIDVRCVAPGLHGVHAEVCFQYLDAIQQGWDGRNVVADGACSGVEAADMRWRSRHIWFVCLFVLVHKYFGNAISAEFQKFDKRGVRTRTARTRTAYSMHLRLANEEIQIL
jgi:hypothetical protein